jgi:signal transduction histidine kinase
LLALASGWLLSRLVGRRVADVVETAEEIMQGDMARRVPVRGGGDEFDRLAKTLNRMLDRIQGLVGDLRMVTDGVAHDLRSPLTRLRAHLDASLEDGIDSAERRERIGRAVAEADGVLRAFTALLEIARAEAGMGRDQFEPVDLGALAEDMVDLYTPIAAEKEIRLVQRGDGATVPGHPQLLANAVANLVENAIAHGPSGSEIALELEPGPNPAITVADDGPGIPAEERARVLERFVRLDASGFRSSPRSRACTTPGSSSRAMRRDCARRCASPARPDTRRPTRANGPAGHRDSALASHPLRGRAARQMRVMIWFCAREATGRSGATRRLCRQSRPPRRKCTAGNRKRVAPQ